MPGIEEVNINAYDDIEVIMNSGEVSRSRINSVPPNKPLMWCEDASLPAVW
jgi:hypothetical protein